MHIEEVLRAEQCCLREVVPAWKEWIEGFTRAALSTRGAQKQIPISISTSKSPPAN